MRNERPIQNHEQRIRALEQGQRSLNQRSLNDGGYQQGGGGSGSGTYYANPGATILAANTGSATMTVYEILMDGDENLGEKTVLNRYPDASVASHRILLSRNSDGSFTLIGQGGCPT